jgi:hypothetical protein
MSFEVNLAKIRADVAAVGWNLGELRILSSGASTLVVGDGERAIRVGRESEEETATNLQRCYTLNSMRAPVLGPLSMNIAEIDIGKATLWPQAMAARENYLELGQALAGLHMLNDANIYIEETYRQKLRRRLMRLEGNGVPTEVIADLLRIAWDLDEQPSWAADEGELIHGDAHSGNVMLYEARPMLIDMNSLRRGPRELDLIPIWCAARRGSEAWGKWREFQQGYQVVESLWEWEHLEEASLERELLTTIFLAEQWHQREWVQQEVRLRLRSWSDPDKGERWNVG